MPETKNIRAKTCGYCGKPLDSFYYRDLTRARGYFCSGDHCMKFIENDNQPAVPGLKEDEVESLYEVQQEGYKDYDDKKKGGKKDTPEPVVAAEPEKKVEKPKRVSRRGKLKE